MTIIRILVLAMNFAGKENIGLEASVTEEYLGLLKFVKLTVLAKNINYKSTKNLKLVKVPKSKKPFWTLRNILAFTKSMIKEQKNFDIVFTRMIGLHLLIPGIVAKIFFRKKLVIWISGTAKVQRERKNLYNRIILKISLILADRVGTFSHSVLNDLEACIGRVDHKKVFFQSGWVDSTFFTPNYIKNKNSRDHNRVICISRIDPIKGIETLIEAIPYVIKKNHKIKFTVLGKIVDESYFEKLCNLASSLNVRGYIEFVGGVPYAEVPDWYQLSDIFVMTSKSEGQPKAILEAMSSGLPVISTPVGSIPDIIENGINGLIVKDDPVDVSNKIIMLLEDKAIRKRISLAARQTIEKKHSKMKFIEKICNVFHELA